MLEALLVRGPLAGQEDEAEEPHAPAEDWNVFERLLEDDVEVAVHGRAVCHPPEIDPVSVDLVGVSSLFYRMWPGQPYLVVRDEYQPFWKVAFEQAILLLPHLPSYALVSTDAHRDGRPPVRHGSDGHAKVLLGHGHPRVEEVLAIEVKRQADVLGDGDAET